MPIAVPNCLYSSFFGDTNGMLSQFTTDLADAKPNDATAGSTLIEASLYVDLSLEQGIAPRTPRVFNIPIKSLVCSTQTSNALGTLNDSTRCKNFTGAVSLSPQKLVSYEDHSCTGDTGNNDILLWKAVNLVKRNSIKRENRFRTHKNVSQMSMACLHHPTRCEVHRRSTMNEILSFTLGRRDIGSYILRDPTFPTHSVFFRALKTHVGRNMAAVISLEKAEVRNAHLFIRPHHYYECNDETPNKEKFHLTHRKKVVSVESNPAQTPPLPSQVKVMVSIITRTTPCDALNVYMTLKAKPSTPSIPAISQLESHECIQSFQKIEKCKALHDQRCDSKRHPHCNGEQKRNIKMEPPSPRAQVPRWGTKPPPFLDNKQGPGSPPVRAPHQYSLPDIHCTTPLSGPQAAAPFAFPSPRPPHEALVDGAPVRGRAGGHLVKFGTAHPPPAALGQGLGGLSVSRLGTALLERASDRVAEGGFPSPVKGWLKAAVPVPPPTRTLAKEGAPGAKGPLRRVPMREVAEHRTRASMWMVIRGVVYDCTKFAKFHVGGAQVLLEHAGTDATEVFDRYHAWVDCDKILSFFRIGIVADEDV